MATNTDSQQLLKQLVLLQEEQAVLYVYWQLVKGFLLL